MASRRVRLNGYFALPGRRRGVGGGGMPSQKTLLTVLLLLAVAVVGYVRLLLPEIGVLQCGLSYAADLATWIEAGSIVGDEPVCTTLIPADLQRLTDFLPLLLFTAMAVVVIRRQGNVAILPAMVATQAALWLSPSPVIALVVAIVGVGVCCVPIPARGWLGPLSHIGGVLLWPSTAIAVLGAVADSTVTLPGGLDWLLSLGLFAVVPGSLIFLPLTGARMSPRVQAAAVGLFSVVLVVLLLTSSWAAAGSTPQTALTPASLISTNLTPAAYSGVSRLYAGYADVPRAQTFSFLQSGGVGFDVAWSTVRGAEATFTTADTLPNWTNPTTCPAGVSQCGRFVVAIPVTAAPGRPEAWVLNGGAEEVIDSSTWHGQHGELTLNGHQYYVILTDSGAVPAGAMVTLKWPYGWDGRGAAALPAP